MSLKTRNSRKADFNMSSLTDIIFLLLIFFLLTSSLATPTALEIILPSATTEKTANQATAIEVRKNGQYLLDGEVTTISALPNQISQKMRIRKDQAAVVIYADKSVQYEYVEKVLDVAKSLRVPTVLATEQRK